MARTAGREVHLGPEIPSRRAGSTRMQIGPHSLATPYLLAPMAGVSEMPFRVLALELGAGAAPTELLSAEGMARRAARTLRYVRRAPIERPFWVQLFGGRPERMAEAAQIAQDHGAEIIDVNMGCPVPKVTGGGAGSALMRDPARAAAIVSAIREATGLPVTAKIRSGWDAESVNAVELSRALEEAGAAAIVVHPRTRVQGYSGRADWSLIARVKRAIRVPVVGNGDVASRADAERMVRETGCDAVMVGRAALGNPWIFRTLAGGLPPTPEERTELALRHFAEHLDLVGDAANGVRSFRKMLLWYARGLHGAAAFRRMVAPEESPERVRETIRRFFGEARPDPSAKLDLETGPAYG